jgi:hypothetical protein
MDADSSLLAIAVHVLIYTWTVTIPRSPTPSPGGVLKGKSRCRAADCDGSADKDIPSATELKNTAVVHIVNGRMSTSSK